MARAKKRLGQHFLSDPRILDRIADALDAGPDDVVIEIGPGRGALTAALLRRTSHVVALEKDRDLVPQLRDRLPSLTVVETDALDADWHALAGVDAETGARADRYLVAGNIPYNITTPLIDHALRPPLPRRIVFLVQKEVAERVGAAPGAKAYGALSVGVQTVARVERLFTVPAGAFQPPPQVDSAVLRLAPRPDPLVPEADRRAFRTFVVGLFGFRRKQLVRAVREQTGWPAGRATAVVEAAALPAEARPETLTPADFVRLFAAVVDAGWSDK